MTPVRAIHRAAPFPAHVLDFGCRQSQDTPRAQRAGVQTAPMKSRAVGHDASCSRVVVGGLAFAAVHAPRPRGTCCNIVRSRRQWGIADVAGRPSIAQDCARGPTQILAFARSQALAALNWRHHGNPDVVSFPTTLPPATFFGPVTVGRVCQWDFYPKPLDEGDTVIRIFANFVAKSIAERPDDQRY